MFVPIYDDNAIENIRFQYVTYSLIALNILVFGIFQGGFQGLHPTLDTILTASFAVVPTELLGQLPPAGSPVPQNQLPVPEALTLLTYMFLHASWWHLGGNMLFLWVFGDNVEDAMGHFRFLIFYLLSGVAAGLAQVFLTPTPDSLLVGASGAVAGVIAAYLLLYPHVWVWILALGRLPLYLKAYWLILAWIGFQVYSAMTITSGKVTVAWWAHIGGFMAGLLLVLIFRRPGVSLFNKALPKI